MKRNYVEKINEEIFEIFELSTNLPSNLVNRQINLLRFNVIEVDNVIAEGGYGVVYKCHDDCKDSALKRCIVNTEDKLKRVVQEIQILKSLNCENVLKLLDFVIIRGNEDIYDILILTEFCYDNLSNVLNKKQKINSYFTEQEILRILSHVIEALNTLHNVSPQAIVHRDVKVDNVLIRSNQVYVLCDFGSATTNQIRPCDVGSRDLLADEILSLTTAMYRAPELVDLYINLGRHLIGCPVDIWAFGVLGYLVCFQRPPFSSCLAAASTVHPVTVPDWSDQIYSDRLVQLLGYCLSGDPLLRPTSSKLVQLLSTLSFRCTRGLHTRDTMQNHYTDEWPELKQPLTDSQMLQININRRREINAAGRLAQQPIATSITPRERRRPGLSPSSNVSVPMSGGSIGRSTTHNLARSAINLSNNCSNQSNSWDPWTNQSGSATQLITSSHLMVTEPSDPVKLVNLTSSNQIQPTTNQIQPATNQIQPTINQIQPTTNQIQSATNQIPTVTNQIQPTTNQIPTPINQHNPWTELEFNVPNNKQRQLAQYLTSDVPTYVPHHRRMVSDGYVTNRRQMPEMLVLLPTFNLSFYTTYTKAPANRIHADDLWV